jgi:hypothetical protein
LRHLPLDSRTLLGVAAVVVFLAVVAVYSWTRRPPDPDEIERRRRSHLNQVGRIVEGQVIEIVESPAPEKKPAGFLARKKSAPNGAGAKRTLVCYSYSISGVSYETAQDVTGLQAHAAIQRLIAGQHASVKYDPANPGNSILIADDWSGLH